jgi:RNA polymerase sigma-70 factor (ECF subfamily)
MRTLPRDEFIQAGRQATMKADRAQRHRHTESSESIVILNDTGQDRDYDGLCVLEERSDYALRNLHDRMATFLPRLRRFARSLTRDSDLCEDLIQETYVRALTHLDQYQSGTRLDSWMFRIAQNLWIDHLRAEKIRGDVVDVSFIDHLLSFDGRMAAENRLALQKLKKDIAQLSMEQRNVIRLVCEYGLSYKETGRILNLPAGTVMSRLARARSTLQKVT